MKKTLLTNRLLSGVANILAFNNKSWKMDGDKIVTKDGNPIYIDTAGNEQTIDIDALATVRREAQTHREAKEAAEKKLATFKGIDDPALALKAIETVSKLDAKKLIDAGEVDKLTETIKQQFTTQVNELTASNKGLQDNLNSMRVQNIFSNSEFIRDSIAMPRDMFESYFRQNFKIDDKGDIIAYDKTGNVLMSKKDVGAKPSHEEALQMLVDMHPQKDIILKANDAKGSGSQGGGGTKPGGRVIKRGDFDNLSPAEQIAVAKKQTTGEIQIVD